MKYFSQFMLFLIAVLVLMVLQYQYWQGDNGRAGIEVLHSQINAQKIRSAEQQVDNTVLKADVSDLKNGLEAVEEHARLDLGLIKPNETFVQLSTALVTHISQTPIEANPEDVIESIP